MDSSKALIRSIARALYDTRHVLVIDALMMHSTSVDMLSDTTTIAERQAGFLMKT